MYKNQPAKMFQILEILLHAKKKPGKTETLLNYPDSSQPTTYSPLPNTYHTLGVLFKLKKEGLIKSLKNEISNLNKAGFRISPKIIEELLRQAGEEY